MPGRATAEETSQEYRQGEFLLSTDRSRLDVDAIHRFLTGSSYWATGVSREVVARSIENSLCFGIYAADTQVGFARVITDYATYAYICDVFVLDSHRGHGLGKWLMQCIMQHPGLQGLRRWRLTTRDAHGLYSQSGFGPLLFPDRHMEIYNPETARTSGEQQRNES